MADVEPCRACGSRRVRERRVQHGERSAAEAAPTYRVERVCLNADCPTNVNPSLVDVV